jgi:hypothetical protein
LVGAGFTATWTLSYCGCGNNAYVWRIDISFPEGTWGANAPVVMVNEVPGNSNPVVVETMSPTLVQVRKTGYIYTDFQTFAAVQFTAQGI